MRKIRESGEEGQRYFEQDNAFSNVKRVHHGADYVKTVRDSAGRIRKEPHEVKRNNSPLSKKQKKTWGLKVDRYSNTQYGFVEKRTYNRFGDEIHQDPLTGRWSKVKKRDNNPLGMKTTSNNLFGSNTRSNKNRSNDFGSGINNMFGFGSSSSSKRSRRNDNYGLGYGLNDMFGSGSSGRRKKNTDSWGFGF